MGTAAQPVSLGEYKMIAVKLNRADFEYDIYSLVKAFFPAEEVTVSVGEKAD